VEAESGHARPVPVHPISKPPAHRGPLDQPSAFVAQSCVRRRL